MFAVLSIGTVVGAMANAGRSEVGERTLVVTAGCVGTAMLAMAVSPGLPLTFVLLAGAGVGAAMFNTASNALLQRSSRGEFHGRVMAAFSALFVGTKGVGGALAGAVAGTVGSAGRHRHRRVRMPRRDGCRPAARDPSAGRGSGDMTAAPWTDPESDFATFERLAHARRSSMLIDRDRPVPRHLVDRLCRLVYSAPNHKRTAPWQVAVFVGDARATLGAELCADLVVAKPDVDEAKLDKTRTKYSRAPAIVVVGCRPDPDDNVARHREDLAAVAAGVENLLLGAAAAGLACLWSSPPAVLAPRTCALAEFAPDSELLAVIYVGWPASPPPSADRPEPSVTWRGATDGSASARQ